MFPRVQIDGPRITLGAPVPEAERSRGWALLHLVTVSPEYAARSRVMISNLEQSGDFDAACHNAFEKTAAQINQQADAYLESRELRDHFDFRARAEPDPRF